MKPRDLFGVLFRVLCLLLVVWGLWYTLAGARYLLTAVLSFTTGGFSLSTVISYFGYGLPAVALGIMGLRFPEAVVAFTYRSDSIPPILPNPGLATAPSCQPSLLKPTSDKTPADTLLALPSGAADR